MAVTLSEGSGCPRTTLVTALGSLRGQQIRVAFTSVLPRDLLTLLPHTPDAPEGPVSQARAAAGSRGAAGTSPAQAPASPTAAAAQIHPAPRSPGSLSTSPGLSARARGAVPGTPCRPEQVAVAERAARSEETEGLSVLSVPRRGHVGRGTVAA